jgi:hypothetical protein
MTYVCSDEQKADHMKISVHEAGSSGRPCEKDKHSAFEKVCEWLEQLDSNLACLADKSAKAHELLGQDHEVYTVKWFKHKLMERSGDHLKVAVVMFS